MTTDAAQSAAVAVDRPTAGIAVVVPTRNRSARIDRLITALREQDDVTEIVVVDDGSTDSTGDAIAAHAAVDSRVLAVRRSSGGGAAAARLAGAQAATADVLLFLDDDVAPGPALAANHLRRHVMRGKGDAGGSGNLVVVGYMPTAVPARWTADTFVTALYAQEYEGRCRHYDDDPSGILDNLWMGNVSLPRELFFDVTSRWPEPLPTGRHEDQHVGLRLKQVGARAVFDRSLLGTHEHQRSLRNFRSESRLSGSGRFVLERSHPESLSADGARRYRDNLRWPLRHLVAATARPWLYWPVSSALAAVTWSTGRARWFAVQTAAARLLRRVEQQHGYLLAARSVGAGGSTVGDSDAAGA